MEESPCYLYGEWNAVYKNHRKWEARGVFETLFKELLEDADMQDVSMDSSCCKTHQHSAGAKKGSNTAVNEHIGMTRGGRNTKIRVIVDGWKSLIGSTFRWTGQ